MSASLLLGLSIWTVATVYLYILASNAPDPTNPITSDETVLKVEVKFPRSLDDLTSLVALFTYYRDNYFSYVLILFCSAYIYKQCFAIPGSVFMNLLAGALFGVMYGFPLACLLTGFGATGCFLLSKHLGKRYVERYFPDKVAFLQGKVESNMDSLFFFLMFLRLFPMTPNWFLNIASPVVNVPIHYFFFSVLIGLMPYNFICVQTGSLLSNLTSLSDIFTWPVLGKMAAMAILCLLPGLVIRRWSARRQHHFTTAIPVSLAAPDHNHHEHNGTVEEEHRRKST